MLRRSAHGHAGSARESSARTDAHARASLGTADIQSPDLFRPEAVRAHRRGASQGEVLRVTGPWTGRLYWVLLALAVMGLGFAVFGHVHEFATGPAIVLAGQAEELEAEVGGYVERVLVRPGDVVAAGQVLVELNATAQQSELARAQEEFDLHLLRLLEDPSDESVRQTLSSLRPRLEMARGDVELRQRKAAHTGRVIDVRVRARQQVAAGEPLVTLSGDQGEKGLVALLPGVYRPQLKPGLRLRFRIVGGEEFHCDLVVREVSDQVVGPAAIKRFLGTELGDAVAVPAASVLVRADLTSQALADAARATKLYPGMQGIAEVAVRDESILATFVPGLKPLLERLR